MDVKEVILLKRAICVAIVLLGIFFHSNLNHIPMDSYVPDYPCVIMRAPGVDLIMDAPGSDIRAERRDL